MDITTKELAQLISNLFCTESTGTTRSSGLAYEITGRNEFLAALASHTLQKLSFGCITELCLRACASQRAMDLLDGAAKDVRIAVSKIKKGG